MGPASHVQVAHTAAFSGHDLSPVCSEVSEGQAWDIPVGQVAPVVRVEKELCIKKKSFSVVSLAW